MRIGVAWLESNNANYRAVLPLRELERRGHTVLWPKGRPSTLDVHDLSGCDVVHVYRGANRTTRKALARLAAAGVPIVYDNDDDFGSVPAESPLYGSTGRRKGKLIFKETVEAARLAKCFSTPSKVLAGKYRNAGVQRVEVIPNLLDPRASRRRRLHRGLVIGWIAGAEHVVEVNRLPIVDALERIVHRFPQVRVESIGVDLGLSTRHRNTRKVEFHDLPRRIGGFDIGIAPLADIPYNKTRSDIKVKEYAASGVPWIASPVGPYATLGEKQGGRLLPDDGWYQGLAHLVESRTERRRLGRNGRSWASHQTLATGIELWERLFDQVVSHTRVA